MQTYRGSFATAVFAGVLVVCVGDGLAQQKFPSKPVRIVLGSTPGATPDILARMIGSKLSEGWGQPVVIENRVGASGVLAANVVAKSSPDGYTLLASSGAFAIRPALVPNLPFDTIRDFVGVAEIGNGNGGLITGAATGVKSIKELIALARAQPGKVFFASPGAGTVDHMSGERFRLATGIKAQHVGFKGQSEAQIELIVGRVQFMHTGLTSALPFIREGRLLALSLTRKTPLLPDVPETSEFIPGWRSIGPQGIWAPAGTPMTIRQQISKEIARILNLPDIRQKLDAVSFNVAYNPPEQQEQNLRADIAAYTKIVKEAGLRPN